MKNYYYLIILLAINMSPVFSQNLNTPGGNNNQTADIGSFNYSFTATTGTYTDLSGSTSLSNGELWHLPRYAVPLPFSFQVNNTSITSLRVDGMGCGMVGYTSTVGQWEGMVAFETDLQDRGSNGGTALSPISYKVEGSTGSRILKVEWKNVGSTLEIDFMGSNNMFANVQIWLYEGTNVIEFRYGQSNVTNTTMFYPGQTGPQAGVAERDTITLNYSNVHMLSGAAASPSMTATIGAITGTPANGTIYRFTPLQSSGIDDEIKKYGLSFYPNPAESILNITSNENARGASYILTDQFGRKYLNGNLTEAVTPINIQSLASGIYFLHVEGKTKQAFKFIKK